MTATNKWDEIRSFRHFGPVEHIYPLVNIQKAIENGPVEIVDFPIKKKNSGFSSSLLDSLPGRTGIFSVW